MSARLDVFVALSMELTCFKKHELFGTGMARAYLDTLDKVVGEPLANELFVAFAGMCGMATGERDAAMRRTILGDEKLGPVARNIVKLWYVGTWYAMPGLWQMRFGTGPVTASYIVSPTAYVEGLLWRAAGAHPPGAKASGYGSWKDSRKSRASDATKSLVAAAAAPPYQLRRVAYRRENHRWHMTQAYRSAAADPVAGARAIAHRVNGPV